MMATPAEMLAQSLAKFRNANRIDGTRASYRKDNPGEYVSVMAYLDGGPRPGNVTSDMGVGLMLEEDARRALAGTEPPPPPPPPPPPDEQPYFTEDFEGTQPFARWGYEPSYNTAYHRIVPGVTGNAIALRTNEGSPGPNPTSNASNIYLGANRWPHAGWEDALGGRTNTHDTWYRVRLKFPAGYVPTSGYNWVIAWHVDDETQSTGNRANSSALGITGSGMMYLRPGGGQQSSPTYRTHNVGQIVLDHWYDLVFHWRWHPDPNVGYYAMWVDGQVAVPKTMFASLYTNTNGHISYNTFDLANYHSTSTRDMEVHFDAVKIGPSAASVGFTP